MKSVKVCVAVLVLLVCSDAFAFGGRWRRTRTVTPRTIAAPQSCYVGTDQERCHAEAAFCAANNIRRHVAATIGGWEGAGWGGSVAKCETCTPPQGMTKTGDASVHGPWGWFRVVSYR